MRMFAKIFIALMVAFVQGRGEYCPYDGDLTARSTPSITIFNQSLYAPFDQLFASTDDGMECTWTIESSEASKFVRLNFVTFHIFNTSGITYGDCVTIYDGNHYSRDSDDLLQELCNRMPEPVYNSTGRYLTVVFRQGGFPGRRWLTMNYTMVSSTGTAEGASFWELIKDKLIYLVIGIAAFVVLRLLFTHIRDAIRRKREPRECVPRLTTQFQPYLSQGDPNACGGGNGGSRRVSVILQLSSSSADSEDESNVEDAASLEVSPFADPGWGEMNGVGASDPHHSARAQTPTLLFPDSRPTAPPMEPGTVALHGEESGPRGAPPSPPPSYDSLFH